MTFYDDDNREPNELVEEFEQHGYQVRNFDEDDPYALDDIPGPDDLPSLRGLVDLAEDDTALKDHANSLEISEDHSRAEAEQRWQDLCHRIMNITNGE